MDHEEITAVAQSSSLFDTLITKWKVREGLSVVMDGIRGWLSSDVV